MLCISWRWAIWRSMRTWSVTSRTLVTVFSWLAVRMDMAEVITGNAAPSEVTSERESPTSSDEMPPPMRLVLAFTERKSSGRLPAISSGRMRTMSAKRPFTVSMAPPWSVIMTPSGVFSKRSW